MFNKIVFVLIQSFFSLNLFLIANEYLSERSPIFINKSQGLCVTKFVPYLDNNFSTHLRKSEDEKELFLNITEKYCVTCNSSIINA